MQLLRRTRCFKLLVDGKWIRCFWHASGNGNGAKWCHIEICSTKRANACTKRPWSETKAGSMVQNTGFTLFETKPTTFLKPLKRPFWRGQSKCTFSKKTRYGYPPVRMYIYTYLSLKVQVNTTATQSHSAGFSPLCTRVSSGLLWLCNIWC